MAKTHPRVSGYGRLILGVVFLAFGLLALGIYLIDGHFINRLIGAGLMGLIAGPVMIVWGGIEMMLIGTVKHGGVFETMKDSGPLVNLTEAMCMLATCEGKASPASVHAIEHALNDGFQCEFSPEAVADRVKRYRAKDPLPLAAEIRTEASALDLRMRNDLVGALFAVATADGPPQPGGAKQKALRTFMVAYNPARDAVTPEMQAIVMAA